MSEIKPEYITDAKEMIGKGYNHDPEYPEIYSKKQDLGEFTPGIYFLFQGDLIVYVGKSLHARIRVFDHQRAKSKKFDSYSIIPFPAEYLDEKEIKYICKFTPIYNGELPTNPILKTKQGWAASMGLKVGIIGSFIRRNKIIPAISLNGKSYYRKADLEGL
jgi:hypothetical protein